MSTFKERLIEGAVIVGTAATIFAAGYGVGKDTNEGTVSFLREKYQSLEQAEARAKGEITALKLELQSARTQHANVPDTSLAAHAAAESGGVASLTIGQPQNYLQREVAIQSGRTTILYDGNLAISLIGTVFEDSPLRHKITAMVGSPGKENKQYDRIDVGTVITFNGYEMRLLAADTFSATFLVNKLDDERGT